MAGYVFISYSRKDSAYAKELAGYLGGAGLTAWMDDAIDYGERWERMIRTQIDGCAAMIAIMTPDAEDSQWVARELARAESTGKPILPLLLDGPVFFRLSDLQ